MEAALKAKEEELRKKEEVRTHLLEKHRLLAVIAW